MAQTAATDVVVVGGGLAGPTAAACAAAPPLRWLAASSRRPQGRHKQAAFSVGVQVDAHAQGWHRTGRGERFEDTHVLTHSLYILY